MYSNVLIQPVRNLNRKGASASFLSFYIDMRQINKYQGEDIAFSVKIYKDVSKTELVNLDDVSEIVIYIYTDGCKKAMFSKTSKVGYIQLNRTTSTEYAGIVDSSLSKLIAPGVLFLEINIAESETDISDGKWNIIQRASIGTLRKSMIKIES